MQPATLLGALSSWEVIVSCLALMLLLPLVFAVASRRSVPRRPGLVVRPRRARPAAASPAPERPAAVEDSAEEKT